MSRRVTTPFDEWKLFLGGAFWCSTFAELGWLTTHTLYYGSIATYLLAIIVSWWMARAK